MNVPARAAPRAGAGGRRVGDPIAQVAGHHLVDDAGRGQDDDAGFGRPDHRGRDQHEPEQPDDGGQAAGDVGGGAGHGGPSPRVDYPPGTSAGRAPIGSRWSRTRALQVSSPSATRRTSSSVAKAPRSLSFSRMATGRPAASAMYTTPRCTAPTGSSSSLSSPSSWNSGVNDATISSRHSRRSPPRRSPAPGVRGPPLPIDQRSCSPAS